jgi:hypothetical protein
MHVGNFLLQGTTVSAVCRQLDEILVGTAAVKCQTMRRSATDVCTISMHCQQVHHSTSSRCKRHAALTQHVVVQMLCIEHVGPITVLLKEQQPQHRPK